MEELKEQARKELDEKFSKLRGLRPHLDFEDIWLFIDSLIDKTVQQTEERIVGIIEKEESLQKLYTGSRSISATRIISIISNKNDNK